MEAFVGGDTWTNEVKENNPTITEYFENNSFDKPYRYGDSFVYKAYQPQIENDNVSFINHKNGELVSSEQFEKELNHLVEFYGKIITLKLKMKILHTVKVYFIWKVNLKISLSTIGRIQNLERNMIYFMKMAI